MNNGKFVISLLMMALFLIGCFVGTLINYKRREWFGFWCTLLGMMAWFVLIVYSIFHRTGL